MKKVLQNKLSLNDGREDSKEGYNTHGHGGADDEAKEEDEARSWWRVHFKGVQNLLQKYGIQYFLIAPYLPQQNKAAKRKN